MSGFELSEDLQDIRAEQSRDQWLAVTAAAQFAEQGTVRDIPLEPLECLMELCRAELMDRDRREQEQN